MILQEKKYRERERDEMLINFMGGKGIRRAIKSTDKLY